MGTVTLDIYLPLGMQIIPDGMGELLMGTFPSPSWQDKVCKQTLVYMNYL